MSTFLKEVIFKTAAELGKMLDSKEISSVELTKAHIEHTKATDVSLKSFISTDEAHTLQQAEASDKRRAEGKAIGPLDGIPLTLKDNICETNQPLTCGSKMLEKYISPYDATVSTKLKNAGAVLWGRANLDEFAMGSSTENSYFGATSNPWNKEYTPGGSSGGSASCVSAGQSVLSLGSDTGGSIRQPAAHCGIVGLKPTYGLVSRYGLAALASSLDQIGPFSRTVEDCALLLQEIAGYDRHDSTSFKVDIPNYSEVLKAEKGPWKVGVPKEFFAEGLNPEVKEAVEKAIKFYESQCCTIVDISLPNSTLSVATYYIIVPAEASSNLARYDGVRYTHRSDKAINAIDLFSKSREEGFGEEVKHRIILGTHALSSGYYDAYYLKAQKVRTLIRNDFEKAFEQVDIIITPTVPNTAFKKGSKSNDTLSMYLEDIFTISCNLSGLPGISIPCGYTSNGLPVGLQIIGKAFQEAQLMAIAHTFEQAHDFKAQHPTL